MPTIYMNDRSNSLKNVADSVINKYHLHLSSAKILYLFRNNEKKVSGNVIYGEAKKASDLEQYLTGAHFIISTNQYHWDHCGLDKQEALMDHLLCHCVVALDNAGYPRTDDDGLPVWQCIKPESSFFKSVLERHGAWNEDAQAVFRIATNKVQTEA